MRNQQITKTSGRELGLNFIGLNGYLRGVRYFHVLYEQPPELSLYKGEIKLHRDLIEAILEDCDSAGNLNPSSYLLRKISRFKKKEGIKEGGTDSELKVEVFCYSPLNEKGNIDQMNRIVEYFSFSEFRRLRNPWILSEKEIKIYSKVDRQ